MGTLLLVLLAQAATDPSKPQVPIAIVISSRRDAGNTLSSALCLKLKDALAAQGVTAMSEQQSAERLAKLGAVDSHACDGSKLCLAKLAELLQGIVIGVDIGKVQKFSAGHLEAVAIGRVESVAVSDFTSDAKGWPRKSTDEVNAFATQVAALATQMNKALQPAEPPKVVVVEPPPPLPVPDAPKKVTLVPEPPPPLPVVIEEPRSRGPTPYVVAGTAVVVAAVAVAMLVLATSDAQRYSASQSQLQGGTTSSYTRTELDGIASSANLKYSVALGTGLGAAVLAGVTGYLFLREP